MKFIKRLIILTGRTSKGMLTLEKNTVGIWLKLNSFNITPSPAREMIVFSGGDIYIQRINNDGKLNCSLDLKDPESLHVAIMLGGKVEMYGTNSQKRMEYSYIEQAYAKKKFGGRNIINNTDKVNLDENITSDTQANNDEQEKNINTQSYSQSNSTQIIDNNPSQAQESLSTRKIEDYFYDIVPKYQDDAIAQENYFEKELLQLTNDDIENKSQNEFMEQNGIVNNEVKAVNNEIVGNETENNEFTDNEVEVVNNEFTDNEIFTKNEIKDNEIIDKEQNNIMLDNQTINQQAQYEQNKNAIETFDKKSYVYGKNQVRKDKVDELGYNDNFEELDYSEMEEKRIKNLREQGGLKSHNITAEQEVAATTNILNLNSHQKSIFNRNIDDSQSFEFRPRKASFYEKNKASLDDFFSKHDRYDILEKILPNSSWVKVNFSNDGRYYVIGKTKDYL